MNSGQKLLLVGSLPPQPSNAALTTRALAQAACRCGINVAVLIDVLAPPPLTDMGFTVLRPFDPQVRAGDFDNWPRLYVVGNKGDSMPVLKMLHTAPGAVIIADTTLFPLALPWLHAAENFNQALHEWLEDSLGPDGAILARSITHHRRFSNAIGVEVTAFDLLLSPATRVLALHKPQEIQLEAEGLKTQLLGPPICEPGKKTNHDIPATPDRLTVLITGLHDDDIKKLSEGLQEAHVSNRISILTANRFADDVELMIDKADAVVLLDGEDTIFCPHAVRAAAMGKPVVHAHQPWTTILPSGSALPVEGPQALNQLILALTALVTVEGLAGSMVANTRKSEWDKRAEPAWCQTLLEAAATAEPLEPAVKTEVPQPVAAATSAAATPGPAHPITGIWALIGAVPANPILHNALPGLDIDACPRFMTPELAALAAGAMEEPFSRLIDHMGFEAPLIKTRSEFTRPDIDRKTRSWDHVADGLLHADKALTFGCTIDNAAGQPTIAPDTPTEWLFRIPQSALDDPRLDKGFEPDSGVYWTYDPVCSTLKWIVFTGGKGQLLISSPGPAKFIITDDSQTLVSGGDLETAFSVGTHGVAVFKTAAMPLASGRSADLLKMLADTGLLLKWLQS